MSAPEETVVQQVENQTQDQTGNPPVVEGQETPEAVAARERDDKGRFRNPLQPRIDELTRDKHNAARERDYWRQRAEQLEKPPEPKPEKPTPDKFDDYGAYVEALTDWKADEKINTKLAERDTKQAETETAKTRTTNWAQREVKAREELTDYDDVMKASTVLVAPHVTAELLDSELGPRIAYHLDRNPDLAHKLNAMTDKQVAKEIGRLETQLAVSAPSPQSDDAAAGGESTTKETPPAAAQVPPKKTTAAPAPAKPAGSGRTTTVPLEKQSMDDYVKSRVAQGASWARR